MALIDKDKLIAQIQFLIDSGYDNLKGNLYHVLSIIDALPEQPVVKKSNALFDECVKNCDPAIMKEVSDNVDKMLGRQPVEGMGEQKPNIEICPHSIKSKSYLETGYPIERQPVEGLEEAACEYVEELEKKMNAETGSNFDEDVAYLLTRLFIAGADWGAEHGKK